MEDRRSGDPVDEHPQSWWNRVLLENGESYAVVSGAPSMAEMRMVEAVQQHHENQHKEISVRPLGSARSSEPGRSSLRATRSASSDKVRALRTASEAQRSMRIRR